MVSKGCQVKKPCAVMAVDPGGTSGVAWGVYDLSCDGIADVLASGEHAGCDQVTGESELYHADQLARKWWEFERVVAANYALVIPTLVWESFVLRIGEGSSDPKGLSPVRITALTQGMFNVMYSGLNLSSLSEEDWECGRELTYPVQEYQSPANAKAFAKKERAQRWGIWQKGMPHATDAMRHLALHLARKG